MLERKVVNGITCFICTSACLRRWLFRNGDLAFTLFSYVCFRSKRAWKTRWLRRHEFAHVRQWRNEGIWFELKYVYYHYRYGYWRNPYEIAARRSGWFPRKRC